MEKVAIKVEKRSKTGQASTTELRAEGKIPCVMYGGESVEHFAAHKNAFKTLIYTPDFKLAEIDIDGTLHKCIMKDIQFHPVSDEILHIDFQKLVDGRNVNVEVPVRFEGSSPGVKGGGSLIQQIRKVKLKTTPENLIDKVVFDISELELNQAIRIKDAQIGESIQIMNPLAMPVATVEVPRALKSLEAEEEEAAAAAAAAEGGEGAEGEEAGSEGGKE